MKRKLIRYALPIVVAYAGMWIFASSSLRGTGLRDAIAEHVTREMRSMKTRYSPSGASDPMFQEMNSGVSWSIPLSPMVSIVRYWWSIPFKPGGISRFGSDDVAVVFVYGKGARVLYNHNLGVGP